MHVTSIWPITNSRMKMSFNLIQMFITLMGVFHTNAMRGILNGHDAVTSGVHLEDLFTRIKYKIPYTYLDDGEGGQLRKEDYSIHTHISYKNYPKPGLKTKERPSETEFTQDLEAKSEICGVIFNSTFYDMRDEEAVRLDTMATKQYLKQNYESVYNEIYTTDSVHHTEWPNVYMSRDVLVGGKEYQERTFRCLTRKRTAETAIYVEYFISAIYKSSSPEHPINGRFVFSIDGNRKLRISALAEQHGITDRYVITGTHSAYYTARNDEHSESDDASSPLCTMSEYDKIRLCAIVLNTISFPDNVKFWPSKDYVEPECEKRKVIARESIDETSKLLHLHSKVDVKMMYDERMVGCKAILVPMADAEKQKISALSASEVGGEDTKPSTIPVSDTADGEKSRPATETYYIAPGLHSGTVIVFKRYTKITFTPFVGISDVHLMIAPGTLKPISILEYHKN